MHDRWDSLLSEHVTLESLLSDPAVLGDQSRLREVSRRYKELTPVVECIRNIEARTSDAEAARELIAMSADATERDRPITCPEAERRHAPWAVACSSAAPA